MDVEDISSWLKSLPSDRVIIFDAHPLIAEGKEPFDFIMKEVKILRRENVLRLETPFRPAPLIQLLAGIGYQAFEEELDEEHWRTWFFLKS